VTEAEFRSAIYCAAMTLATIANTSGDDPSVEYWLTLVEKNFKLQSALHDYVVERRRKTEPQS